MTSARSSWLWQQTQRQRRSLIPFVGMLICLLVSTATATANEVDDQPRSTNPATLPSQVEEGMSADEAKRILGLDAVRAAELQAAIVGELESIKRAGFYYDWHPVDLWQLDNVHVWSPMGPFGPQVPKWKLDLLGDHYFQRVTAVRLMFPNGDEEFAKISSLATIQILSLHGENFTDDSAEKIATLKELTELRLYQTSMTDAGLKQLTALKKLKVLDLSGSQVSGKGLSMLRDLPCLEELELNRLQLTNLDVSDLVACKTLSAISLVGTDLPEAQRTLLREKLPGVYLNGFKED